MINISFLVHCKVVSFWRTENYLCLPPKAPNNIARTIPAATTTTIIGSQVVANVPKAVITLPVAVKAAPAPDELADAVWNDVKIKRPAPSKTPTKTKARIDGKS